MQTIRKDNAVITTNYILQHGNLWLDIICKSGPFCHVVLGFCVYALFCGCDSGFSIRCVLYSLLVTMFLIMFFPFVLTFWLLDMHVINLVGR
jgi:hypothetical protein